MSRAGNSCWRRRKLSRNRRFSALRLTARGICFRAIANPSRGPAPVFLPTRIVIQASLRRKLFLKTCWKSIARVSLSRLGKASLALAPTLWRQSSSTCRTARFDDATAATGLHTRTKTMRSRSFQITGLKCTFHVRRLGILSRFSTRRDNVLGEPSDVNI